MNDHSSPESLSPIVDGVTSGDVRDNADVNWAKGNSLVTAMKPRQTSPVVTPPE